MMAPTLDERAARTDRYLDLLASPIGSTVSMAMAALRTLQKADRIDAGLIAGRIEPALHASTAATAKGALTLLTAAARSRPELRSAIVRVAAAGLEHSQSEVQEAALALIESRVEALEDGSRRAIADRLGVMSAKLRARAEALIGGQGASAPSAPDVGAGIAELRARAERLPSDLRRLAGVDAALESGGADIPRAAFTGMEIPRLDPAKAIVPIATFEELIDEALVAIEHSGDLDRVERVLAGALRFAVDRPADEAKLLAPLAKSLKRYRSKSHDGSDWATPRGALQIVLSAFVADEPREFAVVETDPRAVMVLRTTAMQRAIGGRATRIQLSAPTHQGHWIDPLVLVERSRAADAKGAAPLLGIADQILALLRLAPDHRMLALDAAGTISGEWGAALRYALGGDAPFGTTRSLWVAAARARAPFDDDPRISELLGAPLRGADQAPRFSYRTRSRPGGWLTVALSAGEASGTDVEFGKEGNSFTSFTYLRPKLGIPVDPGRCFTTVALSDPAHLRHLDTYHPGNAFHAGSWAAALWPQHPEPVFALSAKAACMLDGNNYVRPANEPLADGLKLILNPDVPIGPMALLMLCRGLNAIDKGAAQATVDALIVLIDDGRLDGETLGAAMHEFLMSGLVLPKRWPDRVKDVARSSKLALLTMRRAFERALHPGTPNGKLRDMHAWLEILLDLSVEAGAPIEDPLARRSVAAYQDGGKAKNAARTLLELKPPQCHAARTSAAVHALRQRVMRGERWKLLAE